MSNAPDAFVYNATLDRIIDGDTFDCVLDLGFDVKLHKQRVRLSGIDTPESRINTKRYPERAKEKIMGKAAKVRLAELCKGSFKVQSLGKGKYGRILDNPIYQEAVTLVENRLVQAWQDTVVSQREEREKIYQMLLAMRDIKSHIEGVFTTGKLAEMQEEKNNG